MNSKRYTIGSKPATSGPPLTCMVEDGAGEWVKHEDHAEALARRDKEHADLGKLYVLHSDHERVKAQLAEVTRQRDELVEAVVQFARAYEAAISEEPRTIVSTAWRAAALDDARQRLLALAARIQSDQPKEQRDEQ